jgi:RHS repeat-associated protein
LASVLNETFSNSVISSHNYQYDAFGHRNLVSDSIAGATTDRQYIYDNASRLTQIQDGAATPLQSFTYDAFNNRKTKTEGGVTQTYTYNDANQLTGIDTSPLTSFTYDNNGNMTGKTQGSDTLTLHYDTINRLYRAEKSGIPVEDYTYSPNGQRIAKSVGGVQTNYVYNGPDLVGEYNANWTVKTAAYIHGPLVDNPLLRTSSATTTYYQQDGLGSVVAMTDAIEAVVGSQRYDAWGNTVDSVGSVAQYGYTGREPDATGLLYYRARYYDPTIGRFTQLDPLGFVDGINRYVYAINNPVNYTDPLGLSVQVYSDNHSYYADPGATHSADGGVINGDVCPNCHGTLPNGAITTASDRAFMQDVILDSTIGMTGVGGLGLGVYRAAINPSPASVGGVLLDALPGPNPAAVSRPLHEIADEIRTSGHPIAANRRTIAVGQDSLGNLHVGSSNRLDAGMRTSAERLGVNQVPSIRGLHAEEELMQAIPDLKAVGTSKRSPCGASEHNCAGQLADRGITVTNPQ